MPWQQLVLESDREQAILISDLMTTLGAHSVSLQDSRDEPVFDRLDGNQPLWSQTTVSGLWPEGVDLKTVICKLGEAITPLPLPHWRVETLVDQQWERVWLDRYQPININNRLRICPVGQQPRGKALPTIYLDPGLAFGTGTHATTQLCLEWLSKQNLGGCNIIDYGCGSGILAIAALKLGADNAVGVDIDARAVEISLENAKTNAVSDRYTAKLSADITNNLQAEVVIANILAEPLMALAPVLEKMVATGGQLVLSGLLEEQAEQVRAWYQHAFDLTLETRDGWALLAGPGKVTGA
ncbi:MAG: 50S ribosomal protein L11 methyltransferase [Acidiferrobacterales bacterium]